MIFAILFNFNFFGDTQHLTKPSMWQSRETGNIVYTRRRKTKYVLDTTVWKQTQIT